MKLVLKLIVVLCIIVSLFGFAGSSVNEERIGYALMIMQIGIVNASTVMLMLMQVIDGVWDSVPFVML